MMIVKKKRILIAEAAGELNDVQNRKQDIIAALHKTVLKQ
jgi:hypothetical protein